MKENKSLITKLTKTLDYHYKNTGNFKYDLSRSIQLIVKEIMTINIYMIQLDNYKKYCDNIKKFESEINILRNLLIIDKNKLKQLLTIILFNKTLKKVFNIKGTLNLQELNRLFEDIELNIFILDFERDKDISNYIIEYVKLFANNSF